MTIKTRRIVALLISVCFSLTACTKATDNKYSEYTEIKWIPDPDYVSDDSSHGDEIELPSNNNYSNNQSENHQSGNQSVAPKKLSVRDFGAKGDGKTDDGKAILQACLELANCSAGSELVFEDNKTYYVSDLTNVTDAALYLNKLNGVTIRGNNTTILLDRDRRYINMGNCSNVTVQGFNFDMKERSHFVGTVEFVNAAEGYIDVISDRDFGFYEEYTPDKSIFGLTESGGTSRTYLVIKKYTTLDKGSLKYRIYTDMDETDFAKALGSSGHVKALKNGDRVILPTPYIGHCGANMINISSNTNISFKDINVWNSREFVWVLRWNEGKISFDNVNVMPPKDESVSFSSWRDCFHCKENSAAITWTNCTLKGNGDDMFNLSSSMMYVNKVISQNEIICYWPETKGGSYGGVKPGTKIIIWNGDTGELIGKTTLKKVVDEKNNRYILEKGLPKLKAGENIKFCFDSLSSPNSEIINCNLDGTMRFRGGPVTIANCKIRMMTLWLEWEGSIEGPIPHDIAFNNCDFNVVGGTATFRISSVNPVTKWREGLYRLENISFNECTGLKKEYFQNKLVFNDKSTDYVKFTPEIE